MLMELLLFIQAKENKKRNNKIINNHTKSITVNIRNKITKFVRKRILKYIRKTYPKISPTLPLKLG